LQNPKSKFQSCLRYALYFQNGKSYNAAYLEN
jgi:hypothetical protein